MVFKDLPTLEEIKSYKDFLEIGITIFRCGFRILRILRNNIFWHGISKDARKIAAAFYAFSETNLLQEEPEIKKIGWIDRFEIESIHESWESSDEPILLYGDAGTGKSGIALNIGKQLVREGNPILFIRATDFPKNQDPIDFLQNRISIDIPLIKAITKIGQERNLFIIIDQLDSVAGTDLGKQFVSFIQIIARIPNIYSLVVTRTYELEHDTDIRTLQFNNIKSGLLTQDQTIRLLKTLGIFKYPEILLEIASNLLNLSIISEIATKSSKNCIDINSEVKLWDYYINTIKQSEGEEVTDFLEGLARETIKEEKRIFLVANSEKSKLKKALSRGILLNAPGRNYKFRHEQIQDFLCAYSLLPEKADLNFILDEFGNNIPITVLSWLQRLYYKEKLDDEEYRLVHQILGRDEFLFYTRTIFLENLKLEKDPSLKVAKVLSGFIEDYAFMRFFFFDLENPNWIEPLHRINFFTNTPDIKEDKDKGRYHAEPWPAGEYLLKFANDYEEIISSIISTTETRNWIVINILIKLLIKISPERAAKIVSVVDTWLDNRWALEMLPADLLPLAASFIQFGFVDEAKSLFYYIIKPVFIQSESAHADPYTTLRFRSNSYWVNEYYSKQFPILLKRDPKGMLEIFASCLNEAIDLLVQLKGDEIEEFSGLYWRLDIPSNPSKENLDAYNLLIVGFRDCLIGVCNQSIKDGFTVLEEYLCSRHIIFQRIVLYVLRKFGKNYPKLINQSLLEKKFFEGKEFRKEYQGLLRDCFPIASDEVQDQIVQWILSGPSDLETQAKHYAQWVGKNEVSDDDRQKAKDEWIQQYLSIIGIGLPQEAKKQLLELDQKYGKKDVQERPTIEFGPLKSAVSPISQEELSGKSFEDLQEYFLTYKPEDTFLDPRGPLASDFKMIVQDDPDRYSGFASYLCNPEMQYVYICNYLYGITEAIAKDKVKLNEDILNLCNFLIENGEDPFTREENNDLLGLLATQKAVSDFLGKALESRDYSLSKEMLDYVRRMLINLSHHPDPRVDDENQSNLDPLTQSINSVRSMAMHGLLNYSLYVVHQKEQQEGRKYRHGFLEEDVKEILDEKLDKGKDPSRAVHSVYGAYFTQLHYLDPKWTEKNLLRIFLPMEEDNQYWKAAWDAYILWSSLYQETYKILVPQYQRGLRWLGHHEFDVEYFGTSPDNRLAQHVMAAYLRGLTDFTDDNQPLVLLFHYASDEVRSQVVFWLSQVLDNEKPKEGDDLWNKCWDLWQHRVEEAENEDSSKNSMEISNYLRWLKSCPLEFETLYPLLLKSVKYFHIGYHMILLSKYIAKHSENYPLETITIMREMVIRRKESWWSPEEEDEERILRYAMLSKVPEARDIAVEIINYQGEQGDFRWKKLLNL